MSEILSNWSSAQFLILLFTAIAISYFEIFLEYPRRFTIVRKSVFFYQVVLFNTVIAVILFILKAANRLDFITFSDSFFLIFIMGASGFLFFSSKIEAKTIDASKDMLGFKSILSKLKSRIFLELKKYIEEEYPFELVTQIVKEFEESKLDAYFEFVDNCVEHFTDDDKEPYKEIIIQARSLQSSSMSKAVFYLTKILLDIKDPKWVENSVTTKFCINKE